MSARAYISWKTKYAAALLRFGDVPYDHAKLMHEDHIISLYAVDHNRLHALADDAQDEVPKDHFSNLAPMLRAPHKQKSRKDAGIVAKVRTLTKEQEAFQRKVLARPCGQKRERSGNWPSGRKLQSRGFRVRGR